MPVEQKVLDALDLDQFDLPESLKILSVEVEDYVDGSGDDALRVTLVLDESVDVAKLPPGATLRLKSLIRERLIARGVRQFPYIFLVKESERRQVSE